MAELIVCRCEEITLAQIEQAIAAGADSVNEVKQWTRAGMGICQGRTCLRLVQALVAAATGAPPDAPPLPTHRWPVRPVALGALVRPLPPRPADLITLLDLDPAAVPGEE